MRALVLGGGGITGIAWELGVIAGLQRHGVDLTTADTVVGTSAGAYVGALVATGVDLPAAVADAARIQVELAPRIDPGLLAQGFALLTDDTLAPQEARARLGALAREAALGDPAEHVARFAATMPVQAWPAVPRLVVTAVDTATGELVVWDADAKVPLAEAVAASCAVPGVFPPVPVAGTGYFMDGGVHSVTHAALAAGADAVVVIAPTGSALHASPQDELAALDPPRGIVLSPDAAARAAIGPNILDPSRRATALEAGAAQAASFADAARAVWRP